MAKNESIEIMVNMVPTEIDDLQKVKTSKSD